MPIIQTVAARKTFCNLSNQLQIPEVIIKLRELFKAEGTMLQPFVGRPSATTATLAKKCKNKLNFLPASDKTKALLLRIISHHQSNTHPFLTTKSTDKDNNGIFLY